MTVEQEIAAKYRELVRANDPNAPEGISLPPQANINIRSITHHQPGVTPQEIAQKLYDIEMKK